MSAPELSIVVPCHNEEGNLEALMAAIGRVLDPMALEYEVIVTDDASSDRSWEVLRRLAGANSRLRAQRFRENRGESAASWAGMRAARGRYIVTMDADLQNDPADLPAFLDALSRADCVCGTRVQTRGEGDNAVRILSSRTANWVRNALTRENVTDAGCTYRAFRRECVAGLKFFKGMHRFLPTLIKLEGFTVAEIPVANNPRLHGSAHYGVWNRLFASFYDLLAVRWMQARMIRYEIAEQVDGAQEAASRLGPG